jgi:hypothetical protein
MAEITPSRKPITALLLAIVLAGAALLVLAVASLVVVSRLEENNSFCVSCHTQPETTFYERLQAARAVDTASAHKGKDIKCIDCHSGVGLTGRVSAELVGAWNTLKWVTRTARQPAKIYQPIGDATCLKCHQDVVSGGGEDRENHFHHFLARWQAAAPATAGHCVSCHSGHGTDGNPGEHFTSRAITRPVCDACHQVLREGGDEGG